MPEVGNRRILISVRQELIIFSLPTFRATTIKKNPRREALKETAILILRVTKAQKILCLKS